MNGHDQHTSNYYIKETLLGWAIGGSGNEFISADNDLYRSFKGFEDVLRNVLPEHLGFKKITIRSFEVVLETGSGDFLIDAVSGGVSAIIDLAWQIYNCQTDEPNDLTVLIDEIENHLHPSMQRRILPDLVRAFPNIQFIISTHSPLVVGSAKDSKVYALRYSEKNLVISEELDLIHKAKTAAQILNEVLGVPVTLPIWAEDEMNRILLNTANEENQTEFLKRIKTELTQAGLGDYFPEAIVKF